MLWVCGIGSLSVKLTWYLVRLGLTRFHHKLPKAEPAMLLHELGYCGIIENLHIQFFVFLIHTSV